MTNSTNKIMKDIEAERIRRLKLTRKDLEELYHDLENNKFTDDKRISFIADLSGSNEIAYHYELICKEWESNIKLHLEDGFDKYGSKGIEFLFNQIDKTDDEKTKIYTVYLIAEILSKLRHKDFYPRFCSQLITIIILLIKINNSALRCKLIITLGWIGSSEEIDLLIHHMLCDEDALCRAWSAISLMQMSFHRVRPEEIKEKSSLIFTKAITEEKDLYACGIMIDAAQMIFGKKWVSSVAIENKDVEKIEKAKKSALRFLRNLLDTGK